MACAARSEVVAWRDLRGLQPWEIAKDLALPLPFLSASWYFASHEWILCALASSFLFFLAGLRLVHDAYHANLGIARRGTDLVMSVLSILMLGSMHAVQITHLRHHGHCLGEEDVEARSARMKWWQAILFGPLFPIALHRSGWQLASARQRRWIAVELLLNVAWIVQVAASGNRVLRYHLIAMAAGQCLTAFFAVWTVHHDCEDAAYPARTLRNGFKSLIALHMFFHVEHHLFPGVPTCHLPELADRLDQAAPSLRLKQVY